MKFRTLRNWQAPETLEGLVFFAQLLEELLFDYSLDTYKPSAMNTSTLCYEARKLVRDIESEAIDAANLKHVLSELVANVKSDEVAKNLLGLDYVTLSTKLMNTEVPISEKKVLLELMIVKLELRKYKEKTEEILLVALKNEKEKNRIRALTRSYVTSLISIGYSTRFLYPAVRRFFYWGDQEISKVEDVSIFFNLLSGETYNYTAVIKSSLLYEEVSDSCSPFKISISRELGDELKGFAENKNFTLEDGYTYLVVDGLAAMDVFSARDGAEHRIKLLSTMVNLFHHKEIPEWKENVLMINRDTEKPRVVAASQNPMLMCADMRTQEAAIKLNSFINDINLLSGSFDKFIRAAELHALALRSDSSENQLLNLWVALETLVPSKLGRSKAKINTVIDAILPILSLNYIYSLTERLVQDFRLWNRSAFRKSMQKIEGDNERHKLVKLLVLEEYKAEKNELFAELDKFYLLRNRANYFSNLLSSPEKILNLVEAHWLRVDWQIRRIYRTRNQIVHAGRTPSYVAILIKNIHDYLDVVTTSIGSLTTVGGGFRTNDQIFKYADLQYEEYMRDLRAAGEKVTSEDIEKLVLEKRI